MKIETKCTLKILSNQSYKLNTLFVHTTNFILTSQIKQYHINILA